MFNWRDHKRAARRQLHETLAAPARCFVLPYVEGETVVTDVTVRVHDKFTALGDLKGTSFNYAQIEDNIPQIVFLRSEITPVRHMIVSVESGVAYRVDHVEPSDDITITARVNRMRADETTGFPVPS